MCCPAETANPVSVEVECLALKRRAYELADDEGGRAQDLSLVFAEMVQLECDAPHDSAFVSEEIGLCEAECLWRAARAGNVDVVSYLLGQRGVHPEARRAMEYAERYARRSGCSDVVYLLMAHGAAPRPSTRQGATTDAGEPRHRRSRAAASDPLRVPTPESNPEGSHATVTSPSP